MRRSNSDLELTKTLKHTSKLEAFTQYYFNIEPMSQTKGLHSNNIGPVSLFCWEIQKIKNIDVSNGAHRFTIDESYVKYETYH